MINDNNSFDEYAELVKRVKAGDESAFTEIYEKSKRCVYVTCLGILNNEHDAEDAMQETYIAAYNGINELSGDKAFLAWIKKIAANKALDKRKARKDNASFDDAIANEEIYEGDDNLENLPDALVLEKDKRDTLYKIMRKELSDDQFRTILLYYYDELPISEIADILQCPENTVKTKLRLARAKIKSGIQAFESANKISLLGAAAGTKSIGNFFSEYYSTAKIPAPKNLPFKVVGSKGAAAASKAAVKGAAKAGGKAIAGTSAKTAAGTSSAKVLAIIGASVAGVAAVIGAAIGINELMQKNNEVYESEIKESYQSEDEITEETTTISTTIETETEPSDQSGTMESAYLGVLYEYGDRILDYEKFGFKPYLQDDVNKPDIPSINIIDINNDGTNELVFFYTCPCGDEFNNSQLNLAIYTYYSRYDEAVLLVDLDASGPLLQNGWGETFVLDNGNVLLVGANQYRMGCVERMKEFNWQEGNIVNEWEIPCKFSFPDTEDFIFDVSPEYYDEYSNIQHNKQDITAEEYLEAYENYKQHIVLPLLPMAYSFTDMTSDNSRRALPREVFELGNYYNLIDCIDMFGGDPNMIPGYSQSVDDVQSTEPIAFSSECKTAYLDKINSLSLDNLKAEYDGVSDDFFFTYELVYVNDDDIPELLICCTNYDGGVRKNYHVACMILCEYKDGQVIELIHTWYEICKVYKLLIYYSPRENKIRIPIWESSGAVVHTSIISINSDCTAAVSEEYLGSVFDLEEKPDVWSSGPSFMNGETIKDYGGSKYFYTYDPATQRITKINKYDYDKALEFHVEELHATKSYSEIVEELSQ